MPGRAKNNSEKILKIVGSAAKSKMDSKVRAFGVQ